MLQKYITMSWRLSSELPSRLRIEYTDSFSAEELDPNNEGPGYDTKQPDGDAPVLLELWGMWSTPLLPSLPVPLWPGVVAPDRVLSMDQIKLNSTYTELIWLKLNRYDI